jgi:simple sugar transport system permease protein
MTSVLLIKTLATIVRGATPLVFASIGETITERSGVINLSLDGTIMLSAMVAFAVAYTTDSLILGFLAAMVVGAINAHPLPVRHPSHRSHLVQSQHRGLS